MSYLRNTLDIFVSEIHRERSQTGDAEIIWKGKKIKQRDRDRLKEIVKNEVEQIGGGK